MSTFCYSAVETAPRFLFHGRNAAYRPLLRRLRGGRPWHISFNRRSQSTVAEDSSLLTRTKNVFYGTSLILGFGIIYLYVTDTRASAHRWVVVPALRLMYADPEDAHEIGNHALQTLWQFGLHPRERCDPDAKGDLQVEVFGHTLANPIATSAGIDKHADIPNALFAIGPSIIEVGGATPMPQNGNEKPRVFRLSSQNALINRYGLNSEGADHLAMRLRHRVREFAQSLGYGYDAAAEMLVLDGHAGVPPGSLIPGKLLAVNIAKNKFTPENDIKAVADDYVYCVDRLAPYADILVVNVSSPNTPGLRTLQETQPLTQILTSVVEAAKKTDRRSKPVVMVKVSLDEDTHEQVAGICQAVWESGVHGVIVGNTTNRRPDPVPHLKQLTPLEEQTLLERGGFSGPHLFERTVALVKRYKKILDTPPPLQLEVPESRAAMELTGSDTNEPQDRVTESIDTGKTGLGAPKAGDENGKQPLLQPPKDQHFDQSKMDRERLPPIKEAIEELPPREVPLPAPSQPKVIFATGGITNGKQALEVLNAGASVAMVYTALVYGGVGTISRIKDEMRCEMNAAKQKPARGA
jgi:dihydroorotate dehydrogenase